jgi:hypothetical protein
VGSRKTTVPSPYSVKLGADVAMNSIGTKPPLVSSRRITSVAPVGCWMPALGMPVGVGAVVGAAEPPGVGDGAAAGEHAAARGTRSAISAIAGARNEGLDLVMAPGTAGIRRLFPRSTMRARGPDLPAIDDARPGPDLPAKAVR